MIWERCAAPPRCAAHRGYVSPRARVVGGSGVAWTTVRQSEKAVMLRATSRYFPPQCAGPADDSELMGQLEDHCRKVSQKPSVQSLEGIPLERKQQVKMNKSCADGIAEFKQDKSAEWLIHKFHVTLKEARKMLLPLNGRRGHPDKNLRISTSKKPKPLQRDNRLSIEASN
ncbi:hypothetical protein Pelo_615 [Pelomyxa schiedti]|nr:hypothetical protein Pelo_615 [Pelomyxa schiedti]